MNSYWPWWLGALSLGAITVTYSLWTGRGLGVSGAWARVANWRLNRHLERLDSGFDEGKLLPALAAAGGDILGRNGPATTGPTGGPGDGRGAGGFGADVPSARPPSGPSWAELASPTARHATPAHDETTEGRPMPVVCYAALLAFIFLGGLLGALTSGRFQLRLDMGSGFRDLVTGNPATMIALLFGGGVLVGFGTRLAGGCSSGHGLTGCSRLHPVSLLATAVFFGSAVVVSWLLWKVI